MTNTEKNSDNYNKLNGMQNDLLNLDYPITQGRNIAFDEHCKKIYTILEEAKNLILKEQLKYYEDRNELKPIK